MKKSLLTLVAVFLSAAAFAQNPFVGKMSPMSDALKNYSRSGMKDARNAGENTDTGQAPRKVATPVTPPEGMQTEDYVFMATDVDGKTESSVLAIGFSGNDIYVQGLCVHIPNAWIKGTVSGSKITFASGQFLGVSGGYINMYFAGYDPFAKTLKDVVFDYDAEEKSMSTKQLVLINDNDNKFSPFSIYTRTEFLKVIERGGTPLTPHVNEIFISKSGAAPRLLFTIPLVDMNGNAMAASKVSYKIYSDNRHAMAPVTLQKSEYTALSENMTEIPYLFSDNKNIYTCDIDLLMEYTAWNRIGVKAIYSGGGEIHESAIGWFSLLEADTLPAGLTPRECVLNVEDANYDNDEEKRIVKVAVDGENIYISGLASRFPYSWLKGTMKDDVATFTADKYIGEFIVPGSNEVQHYYFNPEGNVEFKYNSENLIYTADAYRIDFADETSDTGLSNYDNYEDAEITFMEDVATTPELPDVNTFEMNAMGEYFVTFYVYAKDDIDEYIMPSKLSYELFVDKGDDKTTPYVFTSAYYCLDSDMTTMPYDFNSNNRTIFNEGDYHTVFINTNNVASWKRFGVKSIYNGGGKKNETPIRWTTIHPEVTGINETGTAVVDVVYHDMQGRRTNAAAKGLLIKKTRMEDGTVKTVKIINK
ncbi:hypothetical protein [Prevotella sp. OH937_COT-195]|uniref:hypothetical protein n=1 Tax=Prevotella sp. OH937_COT-195 TaxID=2491051 RepID=UPI000F6559FB|nr:hypothetical protein [Prevotella sp. OH937_COT-195]RRD02906.1 hypothetical protein EII32_00140 [Prevotella sp. OH937_COT-195]